MIESLVLAAVLCADPPAPGPATPAAPALLTVTAGIAAGALAPGAPFTIDVGLALADGWSANTAGVPGVVLQVDPPPSVRLVGDPPASDRALARNGFLHAPYERLVDAAATTVDCTLVAVPDPGATIGLVVCAYLGREDGTARFVRTRIELPVAGGAIAVPGDANDSTWGGGAYDFVPIGEIAPAFRLPRADGTTVALEAFRNRSRVVLTTYRAFW